MVTLDRIRLTGLLRKASADAGAFHCPSASPTSALADLDAGLVELSLVPVGAGAGADGDVGAVRDRADGGGFREGLSVDDDLDRGRRLDAGDGVPLAVVDRRPRDEFGVAAGALAAAGRLPALLGLHLPFAAGGRVEALAEEVQ